MEGPPSLFYEENPSGELLRLRLWRYETVVRIWADRYFRLHFPGGRTRWIPVVGSDTPAVVHDSDTLGMRHGFFAALQNVAKRFNEKDEERNPAETTHSLKDAAREIGLNPDVPDFRETVIATLEHPVSPRGYLLEFTVDGQISPPDSIFPNGEQWRELLK